MTLVSAPLIERTGELLTIESALASAVAGEGSLTLVEGPPGIGKTSLLRHATGAAGQELEVLSSSGAELEREFPFGVARQLFHKVASLPPVEGFSGAAAQAQLLFDPDAGPAVRSDTFTIIHGLYWLVVNLSVRRPLLLVVDDVQWCDDLTVRLLAYLARRVDELPVAMLVAVRRTDQSPPDAPFDALWTAESARRIWLEPLSDAGVKSLLGHECGSEPGERFAAACLDATGGNPFLVAELGRALASDGITPADENAERVAGVRPAGVETSVLVRLGHLSRDAARVAHAVAALGSGAGLREAAAAATLDLSATEEAVAQLRAADILDRSVPLRFVHPLVLRTIYEDIPAARRTLLHARAAAALHDLGASPERVAAQLMLSESTQEPWELEALRRAAAEAAARGAPAAAVAYLRRALERAPDDERRTLLLELGRAGMQVAEPDAPRCVEEAHRLSATPAERVESATALALALGPVGRGPEAAAELDQVARELADLDREQHLLLEAEYAQFVLIGSARREALDRLRALGSNLQGATPGERAVMAALASYGLIHGEPLAEIGPLALTAFAEGSLVHEQTPERPLPYTTLDVLAHACAREVCERGHDQLEAASRARGSAFGLSCTAASRAWLAWHVWGDVALAEESALTASEIGRESGVNTLRAYWVAARVGALTDRGNLDDAVRVLDDYDASGALDGPNQAGRLAYARGHLNLARGDVTAAAADFLQCPVKSAGDPIVPWRAGAAIALVRSGETERALELAEEECARFERSGAPLHRGIALRALALVRGGDLKMLETAVERLAAGGNPIEHARGLIDLGAALRRQGRRADSRQPLLEGLDLAHRAGAVPLEERARDELATLGARPRRAVLSGLDSLTASERRVARLAAEGLSNPEIAQTLFVTRKTVEMHLGRVYRKLDISSRDELPEALARS